MRYWTRHGKMTMMGKAGKLSSSPYFYYKNSKNLVVFIASCSPYGYKVSYAYIPDEDFQEIDKKRIKSKYHLTQVVSLIDDKFASLPGKKNKDNRNIRNKYEKIVEVRESPESIEEVISFIDEWDKTRGVVYGWQRHSGYDKNFFTNHYESEKNSVQSLFYYIKGKLVGYSVISVAREDTSYTYMIGKCLVEYKSLSWYIDYDSFCRLREREGCDVLVNWGASGGSLLKYKTQFPVHSLEKLWFFRLEEHSDE
jgi:hypothetical protein